MEKSVKVFKGPAGWLESPRSQTSGKGLEPKRNKQVPFKVKISEDSSSPCPLCNLCGASLALQNRSGGMADAIEKIHSCIQASGTVEKATFLDLVPEEQEWGRWRLPSQPNGIPAHARAWSIWSMLNEKQYTKGGVTERRI